MLFSMFAYLSSFIYAPEEKVDPPPRVLPLDGRVQTDPTELLRVRSSLRRVVTRPPQTFFPSRVPFVAELDMRSEES